jgi:hypothetical protein
MLHVLAYSRECRSGPKLHLKLHLGAIWRFAPKKVGGLSYEIISETKKTVTFETEPARNHLTRDLYRLHICIADALLRKRRPSRSRPGLFLPRYR